jgi:glutathione S-transferase
MPAELILYYAPDNASLCVRLLLDAMGTSYRTILVNRAANGQQSDAYLQLNPNGLIPTLETPQGPIYETAAILLWLADRVPGSAFPSPTDAQRGDALARLFWLSNTLHPALRMLFYPEKYMASDPDALRAYTRVHLSKLYTQLDAGWTDETDLVSQCYLAPMLRWSALYGEDTSWFDLSKWENLLGFAQTFDDTPQAHQARRAEGLGQTAFSVPSLPNPPEGSAT